MARQVVWRAAHLDIVCTLARRVTRSPAVYEVAVIASGDVVSVREFDQSQDAAAEVERLRLQFLDGDVS